MLAHGGRRHSRRGPRAKLCLSLAGRTTRPRGGFKQSLLMVGAGLHDLQYTVEDLFAEGDKVADRITWQASHQGELMGIPPIGNSVRGTEKHISRIAEGRIVERWGQGDNLGIMRQLGVVPPPEQ